jgi:hypothetical protein
MKTDKFLDNFKCRRWWALAAGVSTAAASQAQAFQATDLLAFSVGPVTLRPHAAVAERYDDNVFYDATGQVGDFISTASVGVSMSLGKEVATNPWMDVFEEEANFVSLDYGMDYLLYARHSNLNADNHSFTFKNRWKGNRLALKGSDNVSLLTGLIGGGTRVNRNVSRKIFNDNYLLEYGLSEKTRIYLNGSHSTTDYEKGTPLYDENTLRGTAGFGWKALPKTAFFGEVYYGQSAIDANLPNWIKGPHVEFIGGFLGAQGNFTSHLSGMLKVGYEAREFSDRSPTPTSPVVEASITHRYREKTATTLTYSRRNSVSVQTAGASYTSDSVGLRVDQRIGVSGRWVGSAGGTVELGDYRTSGFYANRRDNWYRANVDLSYMIRVWMAAGLGYEFEKFESNGKGIIDYKANRITLRLAIGY